MRTTTILASFTSIAFLLLAGLALYLYATTPVIPSAWESFTYATTTLKETQGNSGYLFGMLLVMILSGVAGLISLAIAAYD